MSKKKKATATKKATTTKKKANTKKPIKKPIEKPIEKPPLTKLELQKIKDKELKAQLLKEREDLGKKINSIDGLNIRMVNQLTKEEIETKKVLHLGKFISINKAQEFCKAFGNHNYMCTTQTVNRIRNKYFFNIYKIV